MSEIRTSIVLDLQGNLERRAAQASRSLERFGSRGVKALRGMAPAVAAAGRGLDRLGNRYTALLTGAAGLGTIRGLSRLEDRLTALGIQADVSGTAIGRLRQRIYEVARAPDVRVRPDALLDAVGQIVEKTGDLAFAEANLRNIGIAIRATGADGAAVGGILAEFQKMGLKDPTQVLEALDVLNVQGKQGAFTLANLAALGPRVVTAYTAMGRTGVPALREMGAALQVIRQGTGSSEMAATAFEALLRTLSDPTKLKMLRKGGVQVFDPEAAQQGLEVLRPINEILVDLVERTKGRKELLGAVFDAEAVRAFNAIAGEYKRTGAIESLTKFMQVQADGTVTQRDAARAARTSSAAVTNLVTAWQRFADDKLTKHLERLTEWFDSLTTEEVDRAVERVTALAAAVGGLVVASKAVTTAAGLKILSGSGAATATTAAATKVAAGGGGALSGLLPPVAVAAGLTGTSYALQKLYEHSAGTAFPRLTGADAERQRQVLGIGGPAGNNEMSGHLTIELQAGHDVRARVRRMESRGLDLDVDAGPIMMGVGH